jgi:hypothetical protein
MFKYKNYSLLLLLIFFVFSISCSDASKEKRNRERKALTFAIAAPFIPGPVVDYSGREAQTRGRLLTSQQQWDIPLSYLASMTYIAEYPILRADYGAKFYLLTYETIDFEGGITAASGALWVPAKDGPLSMLLMCHGTELSADMTLMRTAPGVFAGKGYFSVQSDYLGYGASSGMIHPYAHASTMASSSVDILRAAIKFAEYNGIALNSKLFVTGYSEGGMAALATVREIEANYSASYTITAAAPASGPYDMIATASYYLQPNLTVETNYLAFMIPAYNSIYKWARPLSDFMKEPYASWFTSDPYPRADAGRIARQLPHNTSDFLNSSFISNYNCSLEPVMVSRLTENNTYNFVPQCSIRLYAGAGDTQVPPFNTVNAAAYFSSNSAPNASSVVLDAGYGDHGDIIIPIHALMIQWFSGF